MAGDQDQWEANARLIASAPDLLVALDRAYCVIDWYAFDYNSDEGSRARAALPELESILKPHWDALAAGTQSAETSETSARAEGCQSGPNGATPK